MRTGRSLRPLYLCGLARFSRRNVGHEFIGKRAAPHQLPAQSFDEPLMRLPTFGLGRGLRPCRGQPSGSTNASSGVSVIADSPFDISRRNRLPRRTSTDIGNSSALA
jgi:hypothetical protein